MTDTEPPTTPEMVWFESEGVRCAGRLRRPRSPGPDVPLLVMCHGFNGTADRLARQATDLTEAGFATLAIDYRGFGRSEGRPRQVVDLAGQRQDLRNAVEAGRGLRGIDPARIALWGVSLGGAHVVHVAAEGAPVVGVVAQVPFNGFPSKVEGRTTWQTLRLLGAILRDRMQRRLGLAPFYIPMVAEPGRLAVTTSAEALAHIRSLGPDSPWVNEVAPGALLDMMRYRPSDLADRVRVPLLVCVAQFDAETPVELAGQIAERAPYGTLQSYPATHMDFYGDPALWQRVLADQVEFLHRCFAEPRPAGG